MVQSVLLLYGLIAALTAVGVWQRYIKVSDIVSAEATAITILWRDLGGYPQPWRDEMRDALRGYSEQVVRDAWPQQHRQRLDSVQAAVPGVLWWVLLPGGVGCIVLCLFFHVANAPFQAVLLLGLAGFLAMVLFVIIALDRPFSGDMGITADLYQLVIDHYMQR